MGCRPIKILEQGIGDIDANEYPLRDTVGVRLEGGIVWYYECVRGEDKNYWAFRDCSSPFAGSPAFSIRNL